MDTAACLQQKCLKLSAKSLQRRWKQQIFNLDTGSAHLQLSDHRKVLVPCSPGNLLQLSPIPSFGVSLADSEQVPPRGVGEQHSSPVKKPRVF